MSLSDLLNIGRKDAAPAITPQPVQPVQGIAQLQVPMPVQVNPQELRLAQEFVATQAKVLEQEGHTPALSLERELSLTTEQMDKAKVKALEAAKRIEAQLSKKDKAPPIGALPADMEPHRSRGERSRRDEAESSRRKDPIELHASKSSGRPREGGNIESSDRTLEVDRSRRRLDERPISSGEQKRAESQREVDSRSTRAVGAPIGSREAATTRPRDAPRSDVDKRGSHRGVEESRGSLGGTSKDVTRARDDRHSFDDRRRDEALPSTRAYDDTLPSTRAYDDKRKDEPPPSARAHDERRRDEPLATARIYDDRRKDEPQLSERSYDYRRKDEQPPGARVYDDRRRDEALPSERVAETRGHHHSSLQPEESRQPRPSGRDLERRESNMHAPEAKRRRDDPADDRAGTEARYRQASERGLNGRREDPPPAQASGGRDAGSKTPRDHGSGRLDLDEQYFQGSTGRCDLREKAASRAPIGAPRSATLQQPSSNPYLSERSSMQGPVHVQTRFRSRTRDSRNYQDDYHNKYQDNYQDSYQDHYQGYYQDSYQDYYQDDTGGGDERYYLRSRSREGARDVHSSRRW
mmetsp:Transcript_37295/g.86054  ORF Transcript_37295/g.86054 Transcript_37295/m.86054 type:complete len:580 (+) Transcript_37295:66-1805(+)